MASPQESVTTVNGRRCTRSRARTAATTTLATEQPTAATSTDITISTAVQQTSQTQSTDEAPTPPSPPPPPPSPSTSPPPSPSTTAAEQPSVRPSTDVAASSTTGTSRTLSTSSAFVSQLPDLETPDQAVAAAVPSSPERDEGVPSTVAVAEVLLSDTAAWNPTQAPKPTGQASESLQTAVTTTAPLTLPTSTSSNPTLIASSLAREESSIQAPLFTAPAASNRSTPVVTGPKLPSLNDTESILSTTNLLASKQPGQTTSATSFLPTGDSAGIIAPDRGGDDPPLTSPKSGNTEIGAIAGGVVASVAGLALIVGLLFFCLRKRKSRPVLWKEKNNTRLGFLEKIKSIPSGCGVLVAKMEGKKSGPIGNTYERYTMQNRVSSVYWTNSSRRIRSASEPEVLFAARRTGPTSSKKSGRNLLRKTQSSISSNYRYPNREPNAHMRNQSSVSAISSLLVLASPPPPSFDSRTDPFRDAPTSPPAPTPAILPGHSRRPSSATYPPFHAITTTTSPRASQYTFFGEPGPTRPATTLFTPAIPPARPPIRQSDPFDLDRPEVLAWPQTRN